MALVKSGPRTYSIGGRWIKPVWKSARKRGIGVNSKGDLVSEVDQYAAKSMHGEYNS